MTMTKRIKMRITVVAGSPVYGLQRGREDYSCASDLNGK